MIALDDNIEDHPKFVSLSEDSFGLWVRCIGYCRKNRTDGYIPEAAARARVRGSGGRTRPALVVIEELLGAPVGDPEASPLWVKVTGGYRVHDYLTWNPSKEHVEAQIAKKRASASLGGKASWLARSEANGEHKSKHRASVSVEHSGEPKVHHPGNRLANPDPIRSGSDPDPDLGSLDLRGGREGMGETPPPSPAPPDANTSKVNSSRKRPKKPATPCPSVDDPTVDAWLIGWGIPALSSTDGAQVWKFLNRNTSRGETYADWKAAWRNWSNSEWFVKHSGPAPGRKVPPGSPIGTEEPPPPPMEFINASEGQPESAAPPRTGQLETLLGMVKR